MGTGEKAHVRIMTERETYTRNGAKNLCGTACNAAPAEDQNDLLLGSCVALSELGQRLYPEEMANGRPLITGSSRARNETPTRELASMSVSR